MLVRVTFQNLMMKMSSLNATTKHNRMTTIQTTSKLYFFNEQKAYMAIVTLMP